MSYPKKLEKPIEIVKKKLAKKRLAWLLDGLAIKRTTRKGEDGEYVKNNNGDDFIYLKEKNEDDDVALVLAHECGHRLYLKEMDQKQRARIASKFKEEKARRESISSKEMIDKLLGRSILGISVAKEIIEKGANKWDIILRSGDSVSVKETDALKYIFHECGPEKYTNKTWFPTLYSIKNTAEWFADLFAHWIMGGCSKQASGFIRATVNNVSPKKSTVGSLGSTIKGPAIPTEARFLFLHKGTPFLIQKSEYDLDAEQWDIPGEAFIVDIPVDVEQLHELAKTNMSSYLEDIIEKSHYTGYYLILGPVNGSMVSYVFVYETNKKKVKAKEDWRIKDSCFLKDIAKVDTVSGVNSYVVKAKKLLSC